MAQTAAQKKALADAQALLKKQKASLAKLESQKKSLDESQAALNKQLTDDAYYSQKDSQGKTQAQRDALKGALSTAADIRESSSTQSAYVDPKTGQVVLMKKGTGGNNLGGGTKFTATDGTPFEDEDTYLAYQKMLDEKETAMDIKRREGQSAYDLLYTQFAQYGMGSLVEPLKQFIQQGLSKSEFTLRLRETEAYKKRFAANAKRIASGLAALDEADYIGLEDQYQNIMRNYGLPASYYTKGDLGVQEGFEKFLANDVSATELEDRIMTAQSRVLNANPEVLASLKSFYPDITNGDILAYTLDSAKALTDIKRKVTAAEIGGAATQAGLGTTMARAEELGAAGITKAQAQQGFQTVAEVAPRGGQLAAMYGESPYTQQTAEQEVFGLAGSTEAAKQRKKLVGLEQAAFAGRSGAAQGALGRERAGNL
jgi:hypothetical protein